MKRSLEAEMMDLPGNPKELLEEDLAHLRTLNRYFGNYRNIRRGLRQLTRANKPAKISVLDVGTGSADVAAGNRRVGAPGRHRPGGRRSRAGTPITLAAAGRRGRPACRTSAWYAAMAARRRSHDALSTLCWHRSCFTTSATIKSSLF